MSGLLFGLLAKTASQTPDLMTLVLDGNTYSGWIDITLSRGLDRCASNFDIGVTEGWPDSVTSILPFVPAQIYIGQDLALTGYIDTYAPALSATAHGVKISGRSKTQDLVDCASDQASGQFFAYTITAIARTLASQYGIGLVQETTLTDIVVPDATKHPSETDFQFIDRLCALAGAIATDDEKGNLVLTTAGSALAATTLQQGVNILEVSATISAKDRFSQYAVKGQAGICAQQAESSTSAEVVADQEASVTDSSVPRFRPKVFLSHSATALSPLQTEAQWELNYALGRATRAQVTVQGWRQADGSLWQINQMVSIIAPAIGVDQDLLVFAVEFRLSISGGSTTVLTLTPPQAAAPDPSKLLRRQGAPKKKGDKGGTIPNWSGAGGIS